MLCPLCNIEMRLVPAGISKKTGKPYHPFYSCPECKQNLNMQPGMEAPQKPKVIMQPIPVHNGIDLGKKENNKLICRTDLMVEVIKKDMMPEEHLKLHDFYWEHINK